jgi:hypothetical protein
MSDCQPVDPDVIHAMMKLVPVHDGQIATTTTEDQAEASTMMTADTQVSATFSTSNGYSMLMSRCTIFIATQTTVFRLGHSPRKEGNQRKMEQY